MILVQEKEYLEKRERERIQNIKEIESKSQEYDNPNLDLDSQRTIFFKSESKHNPEYRKESSRFREYLEEMDEKEKKSCVVQDDLRPKKHEYKPKRFFNDKGIVQNFWFSNIFFVNSDLFHELFLSYFLGQALNINEAKIDFHYDDSDDANIVIEIMTYRHLDTTNLDLDVQPTYLRYKSLQKLEVYA